MVLKAARVAVTILQMLANEVRAASPAARVRLLVVCHWVEMQRYLRALRTSLSRLVYRLRRM